MADNLSLFGNLVEQGLKLYDKTQDRSKLPANKRVFLESMLENNRQPITEKDLSKAEQEALKSLIQQKYAPLTEPLTQYKDYLTKLVANKDAKNFYSPDQLAQAKQDLKTVDSFLAGSITPEFIQLANLGRGSMVNTQNLMREAGVDRKQFDVYPNIQYKNYPGGYNEGFSISAGNVNASEAIKTLLGRFNFGVDKKGNFTVNEAYDFNAPEPGVGAESRHEAALAMGPYQLLREYAGEKMPPGQGRPVQISVPMAPLQYRDPFGDSLK
jgi:hypothetical protein